VLSWDLVFNHYILEVAILFQVFGYCCLGSCNSASSLVGSGIRGVGLKIREASSNHPYKIDSGVAVEPCQTGP
jgi:hypothetical protein